jgi:hypothetical protein
MKSIEIDLNNYQSAIDELEIHPPKNDLANVFTKRHYDYLNEFHLFIAYFNLIPNSVCHEEVDCTKANKWINEMFKSEIKNCYYDEHCFIQSNLSAYAAVYYFLFDDLLIHFDFDRHQVKFLFRKTEATKVEQVMSGIRKFKIRSEKNKPEISLLINGEHGMRLKSFKIGKQRLSISENYNDDFVEIHQLILKKLSKKNEKGLVLLHGHPGTGKTSYIRYLISSVNKNVIFLPPNMASSITNPNLLSTLVENSNSIFVIEDAENIIVDRERNNCSPVSALLNICDGLLSDCLNIQIICSFNTDLSKVDNALMRKGRLIAKYEFKELEVEKAQVLSDKLGFDSTIHSAMKLADIYNQDEKDFLERKEKNSIGFRAA